LNITKKEKKKFPLNNLRDKTLVFYFDNGNIKKVARYKHGAAYGKFVDFFENGVVKSIRFFNKIRKDSIWSYYNSKGKLTRKEFYSLDKLVKKEVYDE